MQEIEKPDSTVVLSGFSLRLTAQIGFFDGIAFKKLLTGTGERDLAGFQNVGAVCYLQRHLRVLLDEQDGCTGLVQLADNIEDLLDQDRRQTHRRLVQS